MSELTHVDDPIAAHMAEWGHELLEHLNGDHDDSVLFLGRVLSGHRGATAAEIVSIDRAGIVLRLTEPGESHSARIEFPTEVAEVDALQPALIDLLQRARAASGEEGLTSIERELLEADRIGTSVTRVVDVAQVTPHLRRITVGGGDLTTFEPAGPDTFVYVLAPPPGRSELTIDGSFSWERYAEMPESERPVGAYYTVRRWRPDVAEVDLLCVIHEGGEGARWATEVQPGAPVALWGPRTAYHPPADTDALVLVADETGLPAVAVILEQRPAGMPALVLAEVADVSERQDLPVDDAVEVRWFHRDGAAAGTTTLLADAVRAAGAISPRAYVWGGAESRAMTAVRRHVRGELGMPLERVSLVGYWRRADQPTSSA